MLKRLNSEVEVLKQKILKSHLNKMSHTTSDVEYRNRTNNYSDGKIKFS